MSPPFASTFAGNRYPLRIKKPIQNKNNFIRVIFISVFLHFGFFAYLYPSIFLRTSTKKPVYFIGLFLYLRRESNPNLQFRKLLFYPLNYKGVSGVFAVSNRLLPMWIFLIASLFRRMPILRRQNPM